MGKKLSLGEKLRSASLAASKRQERAVAASAAAKKKALARQLSAAPRDVRHYLDTDLIPKLRKAAEEGKENYYFELRQVGRVEYHERFVELLLEELKTKGFVATAGGLKTEEDPNSEARSTYEAEFITVKIR